MHLNLVCVRQSQAIVSTRHRRAAGDVEFRHHRAIFFGLLFKGNLQSRHTGEKYNLDLRCFQNRSTLDCFQNV